MANRSIAEQMQTAKSRQWDNRSIAQHAAELAQDLLLGSQKLLRSNERTLLTALSKISTDNKLREFVRQMCSQVLMQTDIALQAENLRKLLAEAGGIPTIFSTMGKLRMKAAAMASRSMQAAAMAEVRRIFRSTFSEMALSSQVEKISRRARDMAKENIALALHPLVPDVYGDKSAERYRNNLESILAKQDGVGIAVQPWRLYPRATPYAPGVSAKELSQLFKELLRKASQGGAVRAVMVETGTSPVISIVVDALKLALADAEFRQADISIELPAYLKNSSEILRSLIEWAQTRAAKGAAPLKVLIVKGSHLTEEQECAVSYADAMGLSAGKSETDTRFKRLLHTAINADPKAILPIAGTHNLFDIAYTLLDWGRSGRPGMPAFCLIAGLGNQIARLLGKEGAAVTLKAGICADDEQGAFERSLVNVIDELSRPDGFLSVGSNHEINSMGWSKLRQQFLASLNGREEDARRPSATGSVALPHALNRAYIDDMYAAALTERDRKQKPLPLCIGGKQRNTPLACIVRSIAAPEMEDYRYTSADFEAVNDILSLATIELGNPVPPLETRRENLLRLAKLLEKTRRDIIALLVRDAGLTIEDADAEMRDAIDACRFYEQSIAQEGLSDGTIAEPLGVVSVSASRAHPVLDAVAGISAAWITGNVVVYKPSAHTILLAQRLFRLMQDAGFSQPRLQWVPCLDNQLAAKVMSDPRIHGAIFNGTSPRAAALAPHSPTCRQLSATAGASVVYLSSHGDWRRAVHDITKAAFRRSGQGAARPHLLLVHADIYDNQHFINAMRDAASSVVVHPSHVESSGIGALNAALTQEQLELLTRPPKDETWLVPPRPLEMGSLAWSPGVRAGVIPGGFFASTAKNLPLLGLIRVENTQRAVILQRNLSNGLAAAIYSEDEAEINQWRQSIRCGNLGINTCPAPRPGLEAFGGWGLSNSGNSPKQFSKNYITALCNWQEVARPQGRSPQRSIPFTPWETLIPKPSPDEITRLGAAADSISYWWDQEFGIEHLRQYPGGSVSTTYAPLPLCIRVEKATSDIELSIMLMAALKAGCEIKISTVALRAWMPRTLEHLGVLIEEEKRSEFESRFPSLAAAGIRVRDVGATDATRAAAAACRLDLCSSPALANARLEFLRCMREQVISRRA